MRVPLIVAAFAASALAGAAFAAGPQAWSFVEVAAEAGLDYEHGFVDIEQREIHVMSGGVAAGDVDRDGWVDLYVVRGNLGPNQLWRNRGDGTFEEVGAEMGLDLDDPFGSGPLFVDLDGDTWLDVLVGGVGDQGPRILRNLGPQGGGLPRFLDVTADSGLFATANTFSAAAGDYDRDGDLDLFLAHWSGEVVGVPSPHLWRNEGGFQLVPVDFSAGVAWPYTDLDWSFTPSFADLDGDLWPELVVAGDFGTSQVFRNLGPGVDGRVTFEVATGAVITDENGMGSALGDYDGDGDLDWFVSSIWDPDGVAQGNWGVTGNRLYRNLGDGTFEDATEGAGVREGYWGWGSCFADVDNDGDLDIFHTNGFPLNGAEEFHDDPARLFVSNGDGTFTERSAELGVDDTRQGRGVVCFDYDRDGDIDLFVANNGGPPLLYQNRGLEDRPWLALELQGDDGNSQAIGAFVRVRSGGRTQTAFVQGGSQYLSQNPAEVHFGLGSAEQVDEVEIQWPDGEVQVLTDVPTRRLLTVRRGGQPAVEIPTLGPWGLVVLVTTLVFLGARRLSTRP